MLQRHKASKMYQDAEACEVDRLSSQSDGGIVQASSTRVMINRKTLLGALQMMYCLAKEEIAHTTNFSSLIDLSIQLGSVVTWVRSSTEHGANEALLPQL